MKANEVIRKVLDEHGEITEVYWVACGGSLIDLYPSHFLMNVESAKTSSGWHTAKEFLVATPKKLGKHSLVVMCSHSGNTKEAVDAAVLAYERGAAVVTLTDNAGSKADDPRFIAWVYPWGDGVPTSEVPLGICPMLAAELIKAQEGFEKYDALVMVDESHSAGVVGATGHGVSEQYNTYGRVDIYTGTLGKAFGGALGGFTTGRKEIIDLLRQRSRPYLFSNSLAPGIIGASLEVFKMLKESNEIHDKLVDNVNYFRDKMTAAGFDIKPTQSAICAVMLYDAKLSQIYAARMQEEGIYVTGFYYPVVPKDQARIRVQISAGHEKEHLDKCIAAFIKVGKELSVLK